MEHHWTATFPDAATIDVTCITQPASTGPNNSTIEYRLAFANSAIGELNLSIPTDSAISITQTPTESDVDASVTVPEEISVGRVSIEHSAYSPVLYLPGPSVYAACRETVNGDTGAAKQLLRTFNSPIEIPAVCGSFLTIPELGEVIETLGQTNGYTSGHLHAYRYPLIRGALVSPNGLSVHSTAELETLVETLDDVETIGSVALVDALADVMQTARPTEKQVQGLLDDLGYELQTIERRDADLFFLCYLAQLVLSDGIRAAEGHVMRRRYHLDGHYDRRKTEARTASYNERGREWRRLVCASARQSIHEFTYVLANALYWSGEVARTDSRMDEFLLEAAAVVASELDLDEIDGRAQYERWLSRGHRLRSQNCYAVSRVMFQRAADVAGTYDFLPVWEPIYNEANVHSSQLSIDGHHDQAVEVLDTALTRLFEYNIHDTKLNHIVHHLEGQKLEERALDADFQDETADPVSLLTEASTHYETIGLTRSRDRVDRKLREAKQRAPAADTTDAAADPTGTPGTSDQCGSEPTPTSGSESGSTAQRPRQSGDHIRSGHAQAEIEDSPVADDFLTPPDHSKTGSADLMTSPEDRVDSPTDHSGDLHPDDNPDTNR